MMKDTIRRLIHASPFLSFLIRMADGQVYRVPHPDYIIAGVDLPHIVIEEANGHIHIINPMLITSVETESTATTA